MPGDASMSSRGWETLHKKSPDEPFRTVRAPSDGRIITSVELKNGRWANLVVMADGTFYSATADALKDAKAMTDAMRGRHVNRGA
jgi:hypothetical protein